MKRNVTSGILIMDVITISSDSDTSFNEDVGVKSPKAIIEDNESYNLDWNIDNDFHPPIDCSMEMPEKEAPKLPVPEYEIEDFRTPAKSQASMLIDSDDECNFLKPLASSSASDSETCTQNFASQSKGKQRSKLTQEEKTKAKLDKEQKKLEKEKLREMKKADQLRQKALKAVLSENQRNLKPEENIKFLKVHIDNDIINSVYGGNVISVLQQNNIQYVVESQRKSHTVTWSKRKVEKVVDDYGEVREKVETKEENLLVYVLNWDQAVELIHSNELLSHVETVKSAFTDKKLTLIIYGLGKYFTYKKNKRNADIRADINERKKAKPKASERVFEEAHSISGDQLEFALTDLQIMGKHNCRLLETPEEFSSLIHNFTKSLSQIDFKLERQKRHNSEFGWVTLDSSNQSVKVDKNGNGLLSLWQRQLCQFNAVGLETAQAVVSNYNSPMALMNEYAKCESVKEGELLLQNIQIRRNAGVVSSTRRVGPQLSKKIYKFFTSDDPDVEL